MDRSEYGNLLVCQGYEFESDKIEKRVSNAV